MQIDIYTKFVLSVIAVSLTAIALQNATNSARAFEAGCAERASSARYVQTGNGILGTLSVRIAP